jgi:hypothetical protein
VNINTLELFLGTGKSNGAVIISGKRIIFHCHEDVPWILVLLVRHSKAVVFNLSCSHIPRYNSLQLCTPKVVGV